MTRDLRTTTEPRTLRRMFENSWQNSWRGAAAEDKRTQSGSSGRNRGAADEADAIGEQS